MKKILKWSFVFLIVIFLSCQINDKKYAILINKSINFKNKEKLYLLHIKIKNEEFFKETDSLTYNGLKVGDIFSYEKIIYQGVFYDLF